MKTTRIVLTLVPVLALVALLLWWTNRPPADTPSTPPPPTSSAPALRIGLVPEHDIFALRRSYQQLGQYLSARLSCPVEIRTLSNYEAVLQDFKERQVDAAFLGSLVAVLAMDRFGGQVLVRPEGPDGVSTYRGVIFVRDDSPIRSLDELAGHSIAMLKTTYAGSMFPLAELRKRGLLEGPSACRIMWMGTHDEVISAVVSARAQVGAVKDLRLSAYEKNAPQQKVRRLATSAPVPNMALVARPDVSPDLQRRLTAALLAMDKDPQAQQALAALGAARFVPSRPEEFSAIFDMLQTLGPAWSQVGVAGPPPNPSATRPTTRP